MKRFTYTLTVLVMLVITGTLHSVHAQMIRPDDHPVSFEDANLAAAVCSELGLAEDASIHKFHLETLKTLTVIGNANTPAIEKISTLKGLEYAKNLEELTLRHQALESVWPLTVKTADNSENLPKLRVLDVSHNRLGDIIWQESLNGRENLEELDISHNELTVLEIVKCHAFLMENNMNINDSELVKLVKNNTLEVFGEEIGWSQTSMIREEYSGQLRPDIVGVDAENRTVIVEVKAKTGDPNNPNNILNAGAAVGQILHYASAYIREDPPFIGGDKVLLDNLLQVGIKKLRLFIVIQEPSQRTLQRASNPCELLHAHGINIRCISLSNSEIKALKKETE